MPGSTPLQALPYSIGGDNPASIDDTMQALAEAAEKKLVQVYVDVADRDAKLTVPTNGMLVFLSGAGTLDLRVGGIWQRLWPQPAITSSTAIPANTTGKDGDIHLVI